MIYLSSFTMVCIMKMMIIYQLLMYKNIISFSLPSISFNLERPYLYFPQEIEGFLVVLDSEVGFMVSIGNYIGETGGFHPSVSTGDWPARPSQCFN